jgi:hypothetical protein
VIGECSSHPGGRGSAREMSRLEASGGRLMVVNDQDEVRGIPQ